jgi:hypothetical protein
LLPLALVESVEEVTPQEYLKKLSRLTFGEPLSFPRHVPACPKNVWSLRPRYPVFCWTHREECRVRQIRLEYERTASGMKIAANVAHPSNAHPT